MNRKKESLGEEKFKMPPIAPNATSTKLVYKKFEKEFNEAVQDKKELIQTEVTSVLIKLGFIDVSTS